MSATRARPFWHRAEGFSLQVWNELYTQEVRRFSISNSYWFFGPNLLPFPLGRRKKQVFKCDLQWIVRTEPVNFDEIVGTAAGLAAQRAKDDKDKKNAALLVISEMQGKAHGPDEETMFGWNKIPVEGPEVKPWQKIRTGTLGLPDAMSGVFSNDLDSPYLELERQDAVREYRHELALAGFFGVRAEIDAQTKTKKTGESSGAKSPVEDVGAKLARAYGVPVQYAGVVAAWERLAETEKKLAKAKEQILVTRMENQTGGVGHSKICCIHV